MIAPDRRINEYIFAHIFNNISYLNNILMYKDYIHNLSPLNSGRFMLIAIIKMENEAFICSTKCLKRHHPIFHVTEIKYGLCPRHPSDGRRLKGVLQLSFSPHVIVPGCLCLFFFLKTSRRYAFSTFTSGVQGVCSPATIKILMNPALKF